MFKRIKNIFIKTIVGQFFRIIYLNYWLPRRHNIGYVGKNVTINYPIFMSMPDCVFLHDNTNLFADTKIISAGGKFIMKKNSGASAGLTVVTGNHIPNIGVWFKSLSSKHIGDIEKDVIVEEDVWLGANVTLLSGVIVGRGAIVGAGAVCRNNIPPYSIVIGNPAKVVNFKFIPEEIILHEKELYSENERYNIEILNKNYDKYFLKRINEIQLFIK